MKKTDKSQIELVALFLCDYMSPLTNSLHCLLIAYTKAHTNGWMSDLISEDQIRTENFIDHHL